MKITIDQIKKIRQETKAGVMEIRTALKESKGDMVKAKDWLRKRGLDKAKKKAQRETGDGMIASYIHNGGRVGALVKLACETDFVAKTDDFQVLGKELSLHIAAARPNLVEELLNQDYVRDPAKKAEFQALGKEIAMQVASMEPKTVIELQNQAYIRDPKKTIEDLIKDTIAQLGENIQIKEFCRLNI